jgi:hypothetical protein
MLPPRIWPTRLWVAVAPFGLLLVHAVVLGIQLLMVQLGGGIPVDLDAPGAPAPPPAFERYGIQVFAGLTPGVIMLGVGVGVAISAARQTDVEVAAWGRVILAAYALLVGVLVLLGLPWYFALN